jgi:hypothetical protein
MRLKLVALAVMALCLVGAQLALADEVTRDSYKEQVEPICETNTKANEKILKGVREEVKQGKLAVAGGQFSKAASALKKAYNQIKAVPQPTADTAKLGKWLGYIKDEVGLFEDGAKALKAGQKTKAQTVVVQLTHTANLANNQVLSFGFRYCKLQPSKFT